MFNKLKLFIAMLTMHSVAVYSATNNVCSRQGAITECGEGTLSSLHVAGKATLIGTTVLNHTQVAGMFIAENAKLNTLHVSGMASLYRTQINGQTKMSGMLTACQSTFSQAIYLSSDHTHLSHVTTGYIQIDPGGAKQVLCLANKSMIKGDVVFVSGNGLVAMDGTAKINGKVTGGKIVNQYFNTYCEGDQTC